MSDNNDKEIPTKRWFLFMFALLLYAIGDIVASTFTSQVATSWAKQFIRIANGKIELADALPDFIRKPD